MWEKTLKCEMFYFFVDLGALTDGLQVFHDKIYEYSYFYSEKIGSFFNNPVVIFIILIALKRQG